jgi:hypothetical protein
MDKIDELLDSIDTLPPSPYPLPELFKALTEADSDLSQVVDLISFDPALTAKLLQTCNNAFFARSVPVNDVSSAVNRLGFQTVYRVVATVRGVQVLRPSQKSYGVEISELWRHSVRTAFAAQFIAEDSGTDGGLFFNKTQLQCGDYNNYAYKNCKAYKPLDWNAIEVTVKDGVAHCTCNGEVLEEAMKVPDLGQIALEADKGGIEYRRMRIKTMP